MRALLLVLLLLSACNRAEQSPPAAPPAEDDAGKGVDRSQSGKPAPVTVFKDSAGKDVTLANFRGRPLLLNLWATWCAPCVKELPTLDRLAARTGGIKVIAVSQDSGPQPSVAAFLTKLGVKLSPYHDPKMALSGATGSQVLPTTILYDVEGREVWRYVGDLDWSGPVALKLLDEAAPVGEPS